jgi:hypothetical protein
MLSVLVILILGLWVNLWAGDSIFEKLAQEVPNANQAGVEAGRLIRETLGSSRAINQKLFMPLLTPTPMTPLGGDTSQQFNATISCPSSREFLRITIHQEGTGELALHILYDKGFTGVLNTSLVVSGISVVCANGFMKCVPPGTMQKCTSYVFYLDGDALRYRQIRDNAREHELSGCFCVNHGCRGSDILNTNPEYVIKAVGGMVVSAFLNNPTFTSYAVSDSKIDVMNRSITFYGQDSTKCKFVNEGTGRVMDLKFYQRNPGALRASGNLLLETQRRDPNSLVSRIYSAAQLSTGKSKVCVLRKVASDCFVVEEIRDGDCNVPSSCKIIDDIWDGVFIIQGGTRTGLNPVGSCVTDRCGNRFCYDWTTRQIVYVCQEEKIVDPSPRVHSVARSTVWDRNTGMVYYSDLVMEIDCEKDCPSGYLFNPSTKKCEAIPICPSGFSFNPSVKACVSMDPRVCREVGQSLNVEVICNRCPFGYVFDANNRICVADFNCPEGGVLVYNSVGALRCVADAQRILSCPVGTKYSESLNVCYVEVSCPLGSWFDREVGRCVTSPICWGGSTQWSCPVVGNIVFIYNPETTYCEGPPLCPEGSIWDSSVKKCVFCPEGYVFDAYHYACIDGNGGLSKPNFKSPCPEGYVFDQNSYLCKGDPICACGWLFDRGTMSCSGVPVCPTLSNLEFEFDSRAETCVAIPSCPAGFKLDASRGICYTAGGACPSGYVFDISLGKCVLEASCPVEGVWDPSLGKCVRPAFCDPSSYGSCMVAFNCPNGGVWDSNRGKCVIETACSRAEWVPKEREPFYLGKNLEDSGCSMYVCKVEVEEPKAEVYIERSSTASDVRYGTKTERAVDTSRKNYYYKECVKVATNQWSCPVSVGERQVSGCICAEDPIFAGRSFSHAATVMQAIRLAGQDFICSSKRGKLFRRF